MIKKYFFILPALALLLVGAGCTQKSDTQEQAAAVEPSAKQREADSAMPIAPAPLVEIETEGNGTIRIEPVPVNGGGEEDAAQMDEPAQQRVTVQMTDQGFMPSTMRIATGTQVVFMNTSSRPQWPASDVHPTHKTCPFFDARQPVAPGQSYAVTFDDPMTCPMHDHMRPSVTGRIIVE